jgi:DNA phosphorothioation-dependent restriction protein DptG
MSDKNKTIFEAIYELETSDYFDDLVDFANTGASALEKAMIYFSIVETFAKIITIEFVNKSKKIGQEIKIGWKQFEERDKNYKLKNLKNIFLNQEHSDIAAWGEIAIKIDQYIPYRNILAHNISIDEKNRRARSRDEINEIAYKSGELAEEIYNLIIGAREYLEFEFEDHKHTPENLI